MMLFGDPFQISVKCHPLDGAWQSFMGGCKKPERLVQVGSCCSLSVLPSPVTLFKPEGYWDPKSRCLHEAGAIVVVTSTWASH